MKKALLFLVIGIAGLPVAAIATFVLTPVWRWFEAATGIESIGHSGPSGWCFIAVYVLVLAAGFSARLLSQKCGGGGGQADES